MVRMLVKITALGRIFPHLLLIKSFNNLRYQIPGVKENDRVSTPLPPDGSEYVSHLTKKKKLKIEIMKQVGEGYRSAIYRNV